MFTCAMQFFVLGDGELRGVRAVCSRGLFDLWLVLFE